MKSEKTLMYVITTDDDGEPIIVATSQEIAEKLLFDFMGYPNDKGIIYDGYTEMEYSEHEDNYTGYYMFRSETWWGYETDKFKLFVKEVNTVY